MTLARFPHLPGALCALLVAAALAGCSGAEEPPETAAAPAVAPAPPPPAPPPPARRAPPAPARLSEGLDRGDPAPEFILPVVGSARKKETVRLSDLVGPAAKPGGPEGVIVGFVASWCGRCQASLPTLASLEAEHGSRLRIVLLATDDEPAKRLVEADKVAAAGVRAPVLDPMDQPGLLDAWMGTKRNIPRFYLVDRNGTVRVRDTGFGQKMAKLLPNQVEWLLNRAMDVPVTPARARVEATSVDPGLGG